MSGTGRSAHGLPHPRPSGRVIGVVYLFYFITAVAAVALVRELVVPNRPLDSVANMLAHSAAFRASFALSVLSNLIYLLLATQLYFVFESADRRKSLLALLIAVVGCSLLCVAEFVRLIPLMLSGDTSSSQPTIPVELSNLAVASLRLYGQVYGMGLVFFGAFDLLVGWLLIISAVVPRFFGGLLMVAGVGWLSYLWPPLATRFAHAVQPTGFIAEVLLMAWLLTKGLRSPSVDQRRDAPTPG